jgi:hypothetical protein
MAVIAGLSFSSIFRLRWTREEMPAQTQKVCSSPLSVLSLFHFSLFSTL